MVLYTCKKCFRQFDRKSLFDQHKNRKNDCSNDSGSKTSRKIIKPKCIHCKKSFCRKDVLAKHLKICKMAQNQNVKGNKNNVANVNGDQNKVAFNSPNSNNMIVNLIVFSKDGIKNLSYDELLEIFGSNSNLIQTLTEKINFNPNKPQHHNVCYTDTKSAYGEVYENKKWVRKKIDEILEILVETRISDLNEILNDMSDFLNKKTRNKIKETIEKLDYTKPGARKKLKTYLKPILYNNKDMIIKTRKLTKKQEEEIFKKEQEEASELEIRESKKLKYKKKSKDHY